MTPETLAHIRADVQTAMVENRNDDPSLLPDLVAWLLTELGEVATSHGDAITGYCPSCEGQVCAEQWAEALLHKAQLRAISKIPFDEADTNDDCDPDWRDHL